MPIKLNNLFHIIISLCIVKSLTAQRIDTLLPRNSLSWCFQVSEMRLDPYKNYVLHPQQRFSIEAGFLYHHVFWASTIANEFRTGVDFLDRKCLYTFKNGIETEIRESFYRIPFWITSSTLTTFSNSKRHLFLTLGAGVSASVLVNQAMAPAHTALYYKTAGFGDYIKSGMLAELSLSWIDKQARGISGGFRMSSDFKNNYLLRKNSVISPHYSSFSFFINVMRTSF